MNETIEDIVREMRSLGRLDERSTDKIPRSLQALGLRTYADRIEAAWKRERERAGAMRREKRGNAAKIREAYEFAENNMNKKYELTDETKVIGNTTLHRIRALRNIPRYDVKSGDLGGWIEAESNLSQDGDAWVSGDARVCGNADVHGDAWVFGDARVCGNADVHGNAEVCGNADVYGNALVCCDAKISGNAEVYGNAEVNDNARVCGNARVYGNAWVCGDAKISGNAEVKSIRDYAVFKNGWSSGRWFTYTRSNRMWKVGCFHGTGEELIAKAYKDSELSGKCYEAIVRAVETIEVAKAEAKGDAK